MSNTMLRKRIQVVALILVVSLFLAVTATLATTKLIKAKNGGKLNIASGEAKLVIPPGALEEDTVISADMIEEGEYIYFQFEPDGLTFAEPATLMISQSVIDKLEDTILYGPGSLEILPGYSNRKWMEYQIDHFSLYYFRRR